MNPSSFSSKYISVPDDISTALIVSKPHYSYKSGFRPVGFISRGRVYFFSANLPDHTDPFWARDTAGYAIRRHRRDSLASRLASERKRWNRHFRGRELSRISIQARTVRAYCSLPRVPLLPLSEINVGIDTSRLGSRLAASPPQCVPRQMFLSIWRCIVSCHAVRLFSSPHSWFQRGFFCRYLAICDRAHLYLSRFLSNKKKVYMCDVFRK